MVIKIFKKIIANPIYDMVFKYLLEDLDIARELPRLKKGRRTRLEPVLQLLDPTQKLPKDQELARLRLLLEQKNK